MYKSQEKS